MITDDELKRMEALEEGVPELWRVVINERTTMNAKRIFVFCEDNNSEALALVFSDEKDALFIAASRQFVPAAIEEIRRLNDENKRIQSISDGAFQKLDKVMETLDTVVMQRERLRKALEFYGDKENYSDGEWKRAGYRTYVELDGGKTAREALSRRE